MFENLKEKLQWFFSIFFKYFFPLLAGGMFYYLQNTPKLLEIYIAEGCGYALGNLLLVWIFMRKKWKGEKYKYCIAVSWVFCIQSLILFLTSLHKEDAFPKTKAIIREIEKENFNKEKKDEPEFSLDDYVSKFCQDILNFRNNFYNQIKILEKKHELSDFFDDGFKQSFFNFKKATEFLKDYENLVILFRGQASDYYLNHLETIKLFKKIYSNQKESLNGIESVLKETFIKVDESWSLELKMITELSKMFSFIENLKEKNLVSFNEKEEIFTFTNIKYHTQYIKLFSSFLTIALEQEKIQNSLYNKSPK